MHEQRDFNDLFYQQLRNAPWVMCSVGLHALIFGFLLLLPTHKPTIQKATIIEMAAQDEIINLEDEPDPDVVENKPIEEIEKSEEDPIIKDTPVSDHNETDNDMDSNENLGDPRFKNDGVFEGPGDNSTIGIGGGGGGPFGGRIGGRDNLRASGDGGRTQSAVDAALEWLKNHQSPDGRWDSDGYQSMCKLNKCSGYGESVYDPGLSGLALLCFLGAGESHVVGSYKTTVRNGLRYLKDIQDAEGCFGPKTSQQFQYNHMCAALAMCEAYVLTGSKLFKDSAQQSVNFVAMSRNPYLAWRYGVRDGDNDTSVTGWAVMVLKSAKMADLEVDDGAFRGALAWIDKMTEPEFGRVGYQKRGGPPARTTENMGRFPAAQSESLTGVGVLTRIFAGQDNDLIDKGADLMAKKTPQWDIDNGTIDYYYWYYGTLAMFQVGGERWKAWNKAMKTAIVDNQRLDRSKDEYGSWDPLDPWSVEGGRIYSTTLNCLCLEVYYRYGRVFGAR